MIMNFTHLYYICNVLLNILVLCTVGILNIHGSTQKHFSYIYMYMATDTDRFQYWTLLPILTLLLNFGGFHRTLQRVRLANRGCLLLRTPGPVPFGTCICSNVETILS